MFRNRILKILALLMVLNILIIPLTSFTAQQQNKYKVYAAEGIVDIRFFNAVVSMIGITAAGLATMSPSFSIPEADLVEMKNNFAQSLEADAVKKQAWLAAQTDYLAGGIAKTMGAVELAKIGVNDIYDNLKNYLNQHINTNPNTTIKKEITTNYENYSAVATMHDLTLYTNLKSKKYNLVGNGTDFISTTTISTPGFSIYDLQFYENGFYTVGLQFYRDGDGFIRCSTYVSSMASVKVKQHAYNIALNNGIDLKRLYSNYFTNLINGSVNYINDGNVISTTDNSKSIIPTIPWIDTTVPIGTVVTPAIAAPYAGAVPIDVPITAPIDPPIDEPVDPPVEDNIAGTIAAILAGLTPIAGFLEYILAGQVSLTDAIEAGITGVIDGIGDIAGTLTDGITTSLTDIQTSIGSLLDPPTETLDLDKLKNLNSVLFTKFPFSIPFDFIAIVTAINADPVAPVLSIPFNFQDFGGSNTNVEIDLSIYDNFANIARQIGFIGFVIFMLFNTRKLIWK